MKKLFAIIGLVSVIMFALVTEQANAQGVVGQLGKPQAIFTNAFATTNFSTLLTNCQAIMLRPGAGIGIYMSGQSVLATNFGPVAMFWYVMDNEACSTANGVYYTNRIAASNSPIITYLTIASNSPVYYPTVSYTNIAASVLDNGRWLVPYLLTNLVDGSATALTIKVTNFQAYAVRRF